jgi:hypothetical protein
MGKDVVIKTENQTKASGIENMAYHGVRSRGSKVDLFSELS